MPPFGPQNPTRSVRPEAEEQKQGHGRRGRSGSVEEELPLGALLGRSEGQRAEAGAARMRSRTRGAFTVPMTVRVPVGGGIHAPELHSDSPEAFYAHHPGIKVLMPSTPYDAKGLLISAIRDPDPVIFFEPKRIYRAFREEVPEDEYTVPIGEARVVEEGDELTMISWGASVMQCMTLLRTVRHGLHRRPPQEQTEPADAPAHHTAGSRSQVRPPSPMTGVPNPVEAFLKRGGSDSLKGD